MKAGRKKNQPVGINRRAALNFNGQSFFRSISTCYRGTIAGWEAVAVPHCSILPNKARLGEDGGQGEGAPFAR